MMVMSDGDGISALKVPSQFAKAVSPYGRHFQKLHNHHGGIRGPFFVWGQHLNPHEGHHRLDGIHSHHVSGHHHHRHHVITVITGSTITLIAIITITSPSSP